VQSGTKTGGLNRPLIDVFLVCGFYGAGKTTFLKNVRDELTGKRRIAFLVNEYGSTRIDGARLDKGNVIISEIEGGSIFCSCRHWDFIEALKQLSKELVDMVIMESPGLADPSPLTQDITIANAISGNVLDYRGSVCIVDAVTFIDQLDMFEAIRKQLVYSAVVLINKVDIAPARDVQMARAKISEIAPAAAIFTTVNGNLPFDRVESAVKLARQATYGKGTNTPENRPETMLLVTRKSLPGSTFQQFLAAAVGLVLRVKGHCLLDGGWCDVDFAGGRINIKRSENEGSQAEIVVILPPGSNASREIEARWNAMQG